MSDSTWPYWKLAAEPEAGIYKVIMFAGLETANAAIGPEEKALYVCKSLNGHLNIAFSYKAVMDRRVIQCDKDGNPI